MSSINLFKIDEKKKQDFVRELTMKMAQGNTKDIVKEDDSGMVTAYALTLYTFHTEQSKLINWEWVLDEFGHPSIEIFSAPKAVIVIENEKGTTLSSPSCSVIFE